MGGQQFLVDPRLEIEALQKRRRGELHEVAKAGAVAGQQRQVDSWPPSMPPSFFVKAAAGGDVGLQAEDRIDAQFLGRLIELHRPVQIAVVRQRQGGHPQGLRPLQQPANRAGPVQEAVVAVAMQMGERKRAHGVPPCGERAGQQGILSLEPDD